MDRGLHNRGSHPLSIRHNGDNSHQYWWMVTVGLELETFPILTSEKTNQTTPDWHIKFFSIN